MKTCTFQLSGTGENGYGDVSLLNEEQGPLGSYNVKRHLKCVGENKRNNQLVYIKISCLRKSRQIQGKLVLGKVHLWR